MDDWEPPDPGKTLIYPENDPEVINTNETENAADNNSSGESDDEDDCKYILTDGFYKEVNTQNKCSHEDCDTDGSEKMLECNKCKKSFHFRCTNLPRYQLALFLSKNYRKRYICKSCVGDLHLESGETSSDLCDNESLKDNLDALKSQYKCLLQKMKTCEEDNKQISVKICSQNTDILQYKSDIKTLSDDLIAAQDNIKRLMLEVDRLSDEKQKLKSENTCMKTQIQAKPTSTDKEIQVKRIAFSDQIIQVSNNLVDKHSSTEEENIDTKLENFSVKLLAKVGEIIDERLKLPSMPETESDGNVGTGTSTWSSVVSRPQTIKSLMHEARNEAKIEETEKSKRACNIIIHGAEEVGSTSEEIKEEDTGYVKEILMKIGVSITPSSITRLGEGNESKKRPLKIVMKNKDEKEKIMKNLHLLKGTERYFGKISVKDDYTSNERDQIRQLNDKAKRLCIDNPEKVFKVRGNSKNGWRIVSFPKT